MLHKSLHGWICCEWFLKNLLLLKANYAIKHLHHWYLFSECSILIQITNILESETQIHLLASNALQKAREKRFPLISLIFQLFLHINGAQKCAVVFNAVYKLMVPSCTTPLPSSLTPQGPLPACSVPEQGTPPLDNPPEESLHSYMSLDQSEKEWIQVEMTWSGGRPGVCRSNKSLTSSNPNNSISGKKQ